MAEKPTEPRVIPGSKFSPATRQRAVQLVFEQADNFRNERAAIIEIAGKFGMHKNTLTRWVKNARIEAGVLEPDLDVRDARIAELEREKAELEQTVEILKAATSFFAREYDPQQPPSADS